MSESHLIRFYREESPDSRGRMLSDILAWPDSQLEFVDDFIQWLFPSQRPSDFVHDAPLLDHAQIDTFLSDPALRRRVQDAFDRMLAFYGYHADRSTPHLRIGRSPLHAERLAEWVTRYNHNFRRISRLLECLRILGLSEDAHAFYFALKALYDSPDGPIIGSQTFHFWRQAALGREDD